MDDSFKKAFATARMAGKKKFTWNGNSYNTDLAKTVKLPDTVPVPSPRPTTSAPSTPSVVSKRTYSPALPTDKGMENAPKRSVSDMVTSNVAIGKTAVDRKHRREDARGQNKGAGASVKKMIKGLSSK